MPKTEIDRARELVEREKGMTTEELVLIWKGRRDAAIRWLIECQLQVNKLVGDNRPYEAMEFTIHLNGR